MRGSFSTIYFWLFWLTEILKLHRVHLSQSSTRIEQYLNPLINIDHFDGLQPKNLFLNVRESTINYFLLFKYYIKFSDNFLLTKPLIFIKLLSDMLARDCFSSGSSRSSRNKNWCRLWRIDWSWKNGDCKLWHRLVWTL